MDSNSIVDTLKNKGMASDFLSRSNLAKTYGITNYSGSTDQNAQLLKFVNGGVAPTVTPASNVVTPVINNGGNPVAPVDNKADVINTIAEQAGQKGISTTDFSNILNTAVANNGAPTKASNDLYNEAYTTSGLDKVDTSIQTLMDEIATRRTNLLEATNSINNNPFLSEKTRLGQGKLRLDQAETDINNKQNELKQLQDFKAGKIAEINAKVTRTNADTVASNKASQSSNVLKALQTYLINQPSKALTNGTYWNAKTQSWITPPAKTAVKTASTTSTPKKTVAAQQGTDVSQIIALFKNKKIQNGWKGVNPDDYAYYRNQLLKSYGSAAVSLLDKEMETAGLRVDNTK